MNQLDTLLVQAALRNVESALAFLREGALAPTDLASFKASLDLICARSDLKAALVGNVAKVEG